MDPPEVHVGELPRLVARGALRLLEPRDRLLELALLHQVATDIVVRVAEVGIDLDRLETLARRLLEAPLEAQGPPEERVRLCRRVHVDGPLVELDGALEVTLHLVAIRLPPQRGRAFEELGVAATASGVMPNSLKKLSWSARSTLRAPAACSLNMMIQLSSGARAATSESARANSRR